MKMRDIESGRLGAAVAAPAVNAEEQRADKLDEIAQLTQILKEDRVDVSAVTTVGPDSTTEEINSALRALRLKNNRNRYTSLGEELMMGVAEFIESTFDGDTEIPVLGWRPDYTGYRNTVQTKLMRMRFETSQLVGGIVQQYNMGPVSRIILELLPSLLLYPSQNRRSIASPGLYDTLAGDDRQRAAMGSIRSADGAAELEAASNI